MTAMATKRTIATMTQSWNPQCAVKTMIKPVRNSTP
jgi:hypothetical protein